MPFSALHLMTILTSGVGAFLSGQAGLEFVGEGAAWWLTALWGGIAVAFGSTFAFLVRRSALACGPALLALVLLGTGLVVGTAAQVADLGIGTEARPNLALLLLPTFLPLAFWAYVTRDIFRLRRRGDLS